MRAHPIFPDSFIFLIYLLVLYPLLVKSMGPFKRVLSSLDFDYLISRQALVDHLAVLDEEDSHYRSYYETEEHYRGSSRLPDHEPMEVIVELGAQFWDTVNPVFSTIVGYSIENDG